MVTSKTAKKPVAHKATAKRTVRVTHKKAPKHVPAPVTASGGTEKSYLYAVGRRKEASARVRLIPGGKGTIVVNAKPLEQYFPVQWHQQAIRNPLIAVGQDVQFDITVKVSGGGVNGQAEAVRHGISRALLLVDPNFRKTLRRAGYLTRDPRAKERKKPGLKRARRAPQWKKR